MKKKFRFQWGAFLLFLAYGGLFFLLFARIVTIQASGEVEGKELAALAQAKYAKESILKAERGQIVDRNEEVIASDTLSYRMIAILRESASKGSKKPRHVIDPNKTANVLASYLPMEEKEILDLILKGQQADRYQIEFGKAGRDLSHEKVQSIREHELPGITFIKESKRFYPNGVFASHLIGFALKEQQEDGTFKTVGKMGLESIYNKALTGTDGKIEFESDKWGYILPKSKKAVIAPQDGSTIKLTLDKKIQNFVEDALNRVEEEYSPVKMMAIVADPKTGEILAMSQRPSFHPTTREGLTNNWLNEAVEQTIEPGSTMKMFTLAAAIQENKWDPNATYQSGKYTLYDRTIRDHNAKGWGEITFLEGFQRSSNVSMAYLLERMGDDTLVKYIEDFGFGEKTGIDLPNEARGKIQARRAVEKLTLSYGQGTTVTPIQMIQAATAIANDGVMMKPFVIQEIRNPNTGEIVKEHHPEEKGKPISKETAEKVREVLQSTVTGEKGNAKRFAIQGYSVGGKTGTAQIPDGKGQYLWGGSDYLYSFLGMAPIEDPQLITYVFVQQPKLEEGEIGSVPVSKLFTSIMENSLKYLNIVPNGEDTVPATEVQDYLGLDATIAIQTIEQEGLKPILIGEGGKIIGQYPEKGSKRSEHSIVFLKTEGATALPDFTGWSKKSVLTFKALSGLDIRLNGEGFVTGQSVSPGSKVVPEDPVVLHLKSPAAIYTEDEDNEEVEEMIIGG